MKNNLTNLWLIFRWTCSLLLSVSKLVNYKLQMNLYLSLIFHLFLLLVCVILSSQTILYKIFSMKPLVFKNLYTSHTQHSRTKARAKDGGGRLHLGRFLRGTFYFFYLVLSVAIGLFVSERFGTYYLISSYIFIWEFTILSLKNYYNLFYVAMLLHALFFYIFTFSTIYSFFKLNFSLRLLWITLLRVYDFLKRWKNNAYMMELVDMQGLKPCPVRGPGSSPGVGILIRLG